MVKKTVLYDAHINLDADMVDFAGFMMPIRYKTSIIEEHKSVRENVGMFDTSHMGRFFIEGRRAKQFLDYLVPRDLSKLSTGSAAYTFVLNELGGFKDDIIISQLHEEKFLLVCNAANRDKIWNWLNIFNHIWEGFGDGLMLTDYSDLSCMIAVQGPIALNLMERLFKVSLPSKRFKTQWIDFKDDKLLFSSTGYTGEAGGELMIFSNEQKIKQKSTYLWNLLLENNVIPCALGSRDTLRLEAGYRLYGNDMDENVNLHESGLNFFPFVSLEKKSGFIGQNALVSNKQQVKYATVGFKLLENGIPRHGNPVVINGVESGYVLSGTRSPILNISFGLVKLPITDKTTGSKFQVNIRGKFKDAEVINLPIYDPKIFGMNRE